MTSNFPCHCDLCQSLGAKPSPYSGLWLCNDCYDEYDRKAGQSPPGIVAGTIFSLICWLGLFFLGLWIYEFIETAIGATK